MDSLELPLDGRSILLYGDNGTGKSTISDALEWFYTNKVSHLSSNGEIDLKEALRNASLSDEDVSEVGISFIKGENFNATKTLFVKRGKLITECSIATEEFNKYLNASTNENLLLRYQYLRDFVDNTKGDKLKYLSDIIGFSEVTKKKDVLRKSYNSLKNEIKNQNFEAQINTQKEVLIEKIGAAISREEDLIEVINQKIAPLETKIEVRKIEDIDTLLEHLRKGTNNKLNEELAFLEKTKAVIDTLKSEINFINTEYGKYYDEFEKIASDVESIMQTFLAELLKTGDTVLAKKFHTEESCPLCLQPKSLEDLRTEIALRLKEIEESSKKKAVFDKAKQSIGAIAIERVKRLDNLLLEKLIKDEEFKRINTGTIALKEKIIKIQQASVEKVTSGNKIPDIDTGGLKEVDFSFQTVIAERIKEIKQLQEKDNSAVVYSNVSASKDAFKKIKHFEMQRSKLESQRKTLELIYNEFVKKQKEGLENFISTFSEKINEFYQYMNPDEPFQEIKIVTIGEDDELNGITINYKYNGVWVSPPQKYFSESHLNCFGLSFFLASIEAFNKKNGFVLLDDVISSFDTNHRKRFAELIFEKFSKYQIILLTHEYDWFKNFVSPLAKQKNWIINEIKWSKDKGTFLSEKPSDLKIRIELAIAESNIEGLGNPIRIYLEHSLKEICINLDVKVSFRYNDFNEKRMPDELINALKSRIKEKSTELKEEFPTIERVANSALFGNLLSHDNPFDPKIGDLNAFWADILALEEIFICDKVDCKRPKVSIKNYDNVARKIRCGCGQTTYDWK